MEGSEPPQQPLARPYMALVLIWSTTPLAIVLSLRDMGALWALALRMGLAALVAAVILYAVGMRLVWTRQTLRLYAMGAVGMVLPMALTYVGARHVSSGLISVLFGLAPLIVALLARVLVPGTLVRPLQWLGMVMGLAGLAVMFLRGEHLAKAEVTGVLWILAGVLTYAGATVGARRFSQSLHPLVQTTGALVLSALGCVLVLPLAGGAMPSRMPGAVSLAAIIYSACFGSIIAMMCYFHLIRHLSPGAVSLITLLTPVIAVVLGVLLNHERFQPTTLAGMGLIVAGLGLYVVQGWRDARRVRLAQ
jgi:drug/metabolite transporter (DMT)-like permease